MSVHPKQQQVEQANVESCQDSKPGPDKGKAWLVAIAGSWLLAVMIGLTRTGGVIFVHIVNELHIKRNEASWPPTAAFLTFCAASPFAAILSKHFSIRTLCCCASVVCGLAVFGCYFARDIVTITLLLGLFCGVSQSFLFNLSIVAVNYYFKRHRSTANGIQQAGASFGGALLPPTTEYFTETFGFHSAFLFLGTVASSTLLASLTLAKPVWMKKKRRAKVVPTPADKKDPPAMSLQSYKRTGGDEPAEEQHEQVRGQSAAPEEDSSGGGGFLSTCKEHLRDVEYVVKLPMFWVSCQSQMVYFFVFNIYNHTIADHSKDRGLSLQEAAYVVSVCSAADFVGRLSTGWVNKFAKGRNVVFTSSFGMGALCCLTPLAFGFSTLFAASTLFGFASGLMRTVTVIQFIEYLGLEKFHLAVGISQFACGFPHFFRPALIGYFRDNVGSYNGLFYLNGGIALVSACAWLLSPLFPHEAAPEDDEDYTKEDEPVKA